MVSFWFDDKCDRLSPKFAAPGSVERLSPNDFPWRWLPDSVFTVRTSSAHSFPAVFPPMVRKEAACSAGSNVVQALVVVVHLALPAGIQTVPEGLEACFAGFSFCWSAASCCCRWLRINGHCGWQKNFCKRSRRNRAEWTNVRLDLFLLGLAGVPIEWKLNLVCTNPEASSSALT